MTMISDLPFDLEEEILSRVSINSLGAVRSTCKRWRALCKDPNFTKKHRGALLNITRDRDKKLEFSLLDIRDLPSIKEIAKIPRPAEVWQVYVCEGLFLCVDTHTNDYQILLWNPYLGQTRYIKAFKNLSCSYILGYDINNNPKVLRTSSCYGVEKVEIYNLKSNSWRVLDITLKSVGFCMCGVSLKGNNYVVERKHWKRFQKDCVVCFDFTTERLRPLLHLPFNAATDDRVEISSIRGEQLALLFQRCQVTYEIEFWITTNIEHNAVSWTKLFKVDMKPLAGSGPSGFPFDVHHFFVDKEKKVAVVCMISPIGASYVVGEDGNYKELDPRYVFYYTPSHVSLF